MAVKIRLSRIGARKRPVYRIVAVDSRKRRDGRYVDLIGLYNPIPATPEIEIDEEKVFKWLQNGAKLSDTVENIFRKQGILRKWAAIRSGQPIPEETEEIPATPEPEEPTETIVAELQEEEETPEVSEAENAEAEDSEDAESTEG